ncbi:MAG: hypothetical protein DRI70_09050 [Bacteroidetes bacterium]|nr:MAG: hypothetical protein DRI70_09050 [Bacteroidota bacterium]
MKELERFKNEIDLMEYALAHNYTNFDSNQSSRTCVVLRRQEDNGKIAVSRAHDGHWIYYDFIRGKGGTILDFAMQHTGCNLGQTRKELRKRLHCNVNSFSQTAHLPKPLSATKNRYRVAWEYADTSPIIRNHHYLESRGIDTEFILSDRFAGMVRCDRSRNICFPYFDFKGLAGIEKRNHNFKSYTKGGSKGLWRSNLMEGDSKAVICEAPIDVLSYAKLHHDNNDRTRYFAVGGQISRFQWELIDGLVEKYRSREMTIILAFDNDPAGKGYILQFQKRYSRVELILDLPPQEGRDWNDVLQSNR